MACAGCGVRCGKKRLAAVTSVYTVRVVRPVRGYRSGTISVSSHDLVKLALSPDRSKSSVEQVFGGRVGQVWQCTSDRALRAGQLDGTPGPRHDSTCPQRSLVVGGGVWILQSALCHFFSMSRSSPNPLYVEDNPGDGRECVCLQAPGCSSRYNQPLCAEWRRCSHCCQPVPPSLQLEMVSPSHTVLSLYPGLAGCVSRALSPAHTLYPPFLRSCALLKSLRRSLFFSLSGAHLPPTCRPRDRAR